MVFKCLDWSCWLTLFWSFKLVVWNILISWGVRASYALPSVLAPHCIIDPGTTEALGKCYVRGCRILFRLPWLELAKCTCRVRDIFTRCDWWNIPADSSSSINTSTPQTIHGR
jgi:hypothetical protein